MAKVEKLQLFPKYSPKDHEEVAKQDNIEAIKSHICFWSNGSRKKQDLNYMNFTSALPQTFDDDVVLHYALCTLPCSDRVEGCDARRFLYPILVRTPWIETTALGMAAERGFLDVIQHFHTLSHSEPNALPREWKDTVVSFAIVGKQTAIVHWLHSVKSLEVKLVHMHLAIGREHLEMVELLMLLHCPWDDYTERRLRGRGIVLDASLLATKVQSDM